MRTPAHWTLYKLGDVCKMRGGAAFKPAMQGRSSGRYPFIKVSDFSLSANELKIKEAKNWVTDEDRTQIQGQPFPAGTIIFAKVGEALKQNRIRYSTIPIFIDNNLMGATPNIAVVEPDFLLGIFRTLNIAGADVGTAIPYVKASTLEQWDLAVPPRQEQRRIASILGAYDDLIEVNRRRIALLEAMARGLFEDHVARQVGGLPSASVRSSDADFPKGWTLEDLGDVAEITMGQSPPSSELNQDGKGLPFHQGVSDFGALFPGRRAFSTIMGSKKGSCPRWWCSSWAVAALLAKRSPHKGL